MDARATRRRGAGCIAALRMLTTGAVLLAALLPYQIQARALGDSGFQPLPLRQSDGGLDLSSSPSILVADSLNTPEGIFDADGRHESVVGIAMFDLDSGQSLGRCSGTLINARTVVSAAHCVRLPDEDDEFDRNLGVAVVTSADGLAALAAGEFTAAASHVVPVEYQRERFDLGYDVAVLGLSSRVTDVAPAPLAEAAPDPGSGVTLVGFGRAGTEDSATHFFDFRRRAATNTLRLISHFSGSALPGGLLFTSFDDPDDPAPPESFPFPGVATSATQSEGTTAPGDSGGALFVPGPDGELRLAGVTSGGSDALMAPDSEFGDIAFFTNVAKVRPFIDANNPLIETSARAGDGDWLNAAHWESALVPANFDPMAEAQDPTLPAAFFEVVLDAPGRTRLARAALEIDTLAIASDAASLELDRAALAVVDEVALTGGHMRFERSELDAWRLGLEAGTLAVGPQSLVRALDARPGAGLWMRGGSLSLSGRLLGEVIDLQGGEIRVEEGARLADASGSRLSGGTLLVQGELVSSELVLDGALLAGEGEVIAPNGVLHRGGVLAPGARPGASTLTIRGDLWQTPQATTVIGIDGAGMNDRLRVRNVSSELGGSVVLDGTVVFDFAPGLAPGRGAELTFIETDGTLESHARAHGGPRASDGAPTALRIEEELIIADDTATARVAALPYADFAESAQQRAMARLLDGESSPTSVPSGELGAVVARLDTLGVNGRVQGALQSMSPTRVFLFDRFGLQLSRVMANTLTQRAGVLREGGHGGADMRQVRLEAPLFVATDADPRLRRAVASLASAGGDGARYPAASEQAVAGRAGFFLAADMIVGDVTAADGRADLGSHFVTAGIDRRIGEQALIGLAGSYAGFSADHGGAGDARAQSLGVNLYGSFVYAPIHVSIYGGRHWLDLDSRRRVRLEADALANGEARARQFLAGFEIGGSYDVGPFELGPLLRLRDMRLDIDGLEEQGAGPLSVTMDGRMARETLLGVGGQGRFDWVGERHSTSLFARLTWQQRLAGDSRFSATASLQGEPDRPFGVPGVALDRHYGSFSVGVTSLIGASLSLQLGYESDIARDGVAERQLSFGIRAGF